MTLKQVIEYVSDIKPNAFSQNTLTAWVNECEGHIQTEILCINMDDIIVYDYSEDENKDLIVSPPHDKLYGLYLIAMIDFAHGEYSKYENTMQLYNSALEEFAKWFIRTHTRSSDADVCGYYISAYGLAKKHGYSGTETEWLASLKGEQGVQGIQGIQGIQGPPGAVSSVTKPQGTNGKISVDGTELVVFDDTAIQNSINTIESDIYTAEGNIATLQNSVFILQSDISTVQGDVDTLESDLTVTNGNITTLQGDVDTLQTNYTQLDTTINRVDGKVLTLDNGLSAVSSKIFTIDSDITALQGSVNTAVGDIAVLQDNNQYLLINITEERTDIDTLQSDVATVQNYVGEFQTNFTQLDTTIDGAVSDILTLQGGLSSIESDLSAAEVSITALQSTVVVKEDVSNKVTAVSSSSTDTQYPSAKCVYDLIGDIESALDGIIALQNTLIGGAS